MGAQVLYKPRAKRMQKEVELERGPESRNYNPEALEASRLRALKLDSSRVALRADFCLMAVWCTRSHLACSAAGCCGTCRGMPFVLSSPACMPSEPCHTPVTQYKASNHALWYAAADQACCAAAGAGYTLRRWASSCSCGRAWSTWTRRGRSRAQPSPSRRRRSRR